MNVASKGGIQIPGLAEVWGRTHRAGPLVVATWTSERGVAATSWARPLPSLSSKGRKFSEGAAQEQGLSASCTPAR